MLDSGSHFAEGFGPSQFWPSEDSSFQRYALPGRRASSRSILRLHCPARPGVYGMWNEDGELIYVGKSKRLRSRLLSYYRARGVDRRAKRIRERAKAIGWEVVTDEFGALLRELELIRRWRPRFNVRGQPGRAGRAYVCLGDAPAPYVYLDVQPRAKA